jgi:hypothetical protein
VWRTLSEAYNHHCIRRRWKGFKKVMFWSCFSYEEKGPCHIREDETAKEKKEAKEWMEKINTKIEECRQAWELETAMRRFGVQRSTRGPRPKWRFTVKTGMLERKASRGGIDWYRYYREILEKSSYLLPRNARKSVHRQLSKRIMLAHIPTIIKPRFTLYGRL